VPETLFADSVIAELTELPVVVNEDVLSASKTKTGIVEGTARDALGKQKDSIKGRRMIPLMALFNNLISLTQKEFPRKS
jgi:hypothetical protein